MASQIGSRSGPYTSGGSRFLAISSERTVIKEVFVKGTVPETQLQLFHSINASTEARAQPALAAKVSVMMKSGQGRSRLQQLGQVVSTVSSLLRQGLAVRLVM
jgi:hypothetical protein